MISLHQRPQKLFLRIFLQIRRGCLYGIFQMQADIGEVELEELCNIIVCKCFSRGQTSNRRVAEREHHQRLNVVIVWQEMIKSRVQGIERVSLCEKVCSYYQGKTIVPKCRFFSKNAFINNRYGS